MSLCRGTDSSQSVRIISYMTERIVCGADNTSLKSVWYDETSRNDFETFFV